ncbi:MAG: hypothetical protein LJE91_07375 [Gammaproteobacteria bacterium]|jgi:hypothetical protein|nr:hypothetical protein [Gammaproteobacteria bacterium]
MSFDRNRLRATRRDQVRDYARHLARSHEDEHQWQARTNRASLYAAAIATGNVLTPAEQTQATIDRMTAYRRTRAPATKLYLSVTGIIHRLDLPRAPGALRGFYVPVGQVQESRGEFPFFPAHRLFAVGM